MRPTTWPGNVRELQNVVERAIVVCDSETISIDATWVTREGPRAPTSESMPGVTSVTQAMREKEMIEAALMESRGRVSSASGAAAKPGIPRHTLESIILRLGIN